MAHGIFSEEAKKTYRDRDTLNHHRFILLVSCAPNTNPCMCEEKKIVPHVQNGCHFQSQPLFVVLLFVSNRKMETLKVECEIPWECGQSGEREKME